MANKHANDTKRGNQEFVARKKVQQQNGSWKNSQPPAQAFAKHTGQTNNPSQPQTPPIEPAFSAGSMPCSFSPGQISTGGPLPAPPGSQVAHANCPQNMVPAMVVLIVVHLRILSQQTGVGQMGCQINYNNTWYFQMDKTMYSPVNAGNQQSTSNGQDNVQSTEILPPSNMQGNFPVNHQQNQGRPSTRGGRSYRRGGGGDRFSGRRGRQ